MEHDDGDLLIQLAEEMVNYQQLLIASPGNVIIQRALSENVTAMSNLLSKMTGEVTHHYEMHQLSRNA